MDALRERLEHDLKNLRLELAQSKKTKIFKSLTAKFA